jgi:hypothetical protein
MIDIPSINLTFVTMTTQSPMAEQNVIDGEQLEENTWICTIKAGSDCFLLNTESMELIIDNPDKKLVWEVVDRIELLHSNGSHIKTIENTELYILLHECRYENDSIYLSLKNPAPINIWYGWKRPVILVLKTKHPSIQPKLKYSVVPYSMSNHCSHSLDRYCIKSKMDRHELFDFSFYVSNRTSCITFCVLVDENPIDVDLLVGVNVTLNNYNYQTLFPHNRLNTWTHKIYFPSFDIKSHEKMRIMLRFDESILDKHHQIVAFVDEHNDYLFSREKDHIGWRYL